MRRLVIFLLIFLLFFSQNVVHSAELEDYVDLDKPWEGQNEFSNQRYEQVVDTLEKKKRASEEKKRKKIFKKISGGGSSLHEELNPNKNIKNDDIFVKKEDLLLNLPVDIVIDGKILESGYYKIVGEKDKDKNIIISFCQSQYVKGYVYATETEDDYEQEKIDFVEIKPFNDSYMKLIYGSLDFNAFAYIQFVNK